MLDAALAAAPRHHGALHLKVHLVEALYLLWLYLLWLYSLWLLHLKVHLVEAHATRAVEATPYAEALRDVAAESLPGLPHLAHMPAHIFLRTGRCEACSPSSRPQPQPQPQPSPQPY